MRTAWLLVIAVIGAATLADAAPRRTLVKTPGFALTEDGGSRLFVTLSRKAAVEERRGEGTLTYVLKGTSVRAHNNTRVLVTEHFNTPVRQAQLVRRGADLHLIVKLRAESSPTWRLVESDDGTAALQIDFPTGTFITAEEANAPIPTPSRTGGELVPTSGETRDRADRTPDRSDRRESARQRAGASLREQRERMREQSGPKDTTWRERTEQAKPRPLPKQDPAAEERERAMKQKKREQRDAVHREQQALDKPGGPGTAVEVNER